MLIDVCSVEYIESLEYFLNFLNFWRDLKAPKPGRLEALPRSTSCQVADPEACWATTYRRESLTSVGGTTLDTTFLSSEF